LTAAGGEERAPETLAVPRDALLSDEGRDFVFVHWKEDYFIRRDVVKGMEVGSEVEIRDGLEEGEIVVAEGSFLLKSDILREKMGAGCAD
jgi:cobalt-zinc-cadmium efflux system membrane fusion protein